MTKLKHYWYFLTHLGIDTNSSYLEIKRISMVNITCMFCILPAFCFSIINFFEHRYILSCLNLLTATSYSGVLILQHFKRHDTAKILLLCTSCIIFFISGLLYRNGGEYFLLSALLISMLLYDNIKFLVAGGVVITFGILMIYAFPNINFIEPPVDKSRALYNITSSMLFLITASVFFKHVIFNDKKKIEEQRLRLEQMNSEKERIFSIIAHDMRAPLVNTSIIIDIFEANTINKDNMQDFILQLKKQIDDQNKVLDHILTWSSSSMKGEHNARRKVSIQEVLANCIEEFKFNYYRKGLLIHLQNDTSDYVFANYDHLKIIFRNLISNAIKFSYQDGQIYVYITLDDDRVYVHIQDEGIGMDTKKSEELFNTVQQRSLGTSNESGSGLGLKLCKELIEINEGTFNIQSTPKLGSTFTVSFPKYKNPEEANFNLAKIARTLHSQKQAPEKIN